MDIASGCGYPGSSLTNFAPHHFVFDGVECAGMEGLLQSFKFSNPDMQVEVCKLVGKAAKFKGKKKRWYQYQILYWKGVEYRRDSKEYQDLLDRAYDALYTNPGFRKALIATCGATLTHSIGRKKKNETVLTQQEFCSRLMKLRARAIKEQREM